VKWSEPGAVATGLFDASNRLRAVRSLVNKKGGPERSALTSNLVTRSLPLPVLTFTGKFFLQYRRLGRLIVAALR
jgi:hypothetical protein